MRRFQIAAVIAVIIIGGLTAGCQKSGNPTSTVARNVLFSEGFEGNLSAIYSPVIYEWGLMSATTVHAHSGTHSATTDSNNTSLRKTIDDAIYDSIAGIEFYLYAGKAEHTNLFAGIARTGSSANGLYCILGIGIDKSDSLKYIYQYEPEDTVNNEQKNFAPLTYNKWYKCTIEYNFDSDTVTYLVDDAIVYKRASRNLQALATFVAIRDDLGAQGPKDYFLDDVTIYKR